MERAKLNIIVAIGVLVVLVAMLLPGYTKLQDLLTENKRLERRVAELTESIGTLKEEKDKLESDFLYIEKVARDKLGVVREDELIIKEKPDNTR